MGALKRLVSVAALALAFVSSCSRAPSAAARAQAMAAHEEDGRQEMRRFECSFARKTALGHLRDGGPVRDECAFMQANGCEVRCDADGGLR